MILCFGVLIMDMFPSEKGMKLVEVPAFIPAPGGAAANVAVAVKRLGADSAFVGKVGNDQFGHYLCDVLKKDGVNVDGVIFDPYIRTTLNFHAIREDQTIEFLFYRNPGGDNSIRPEEINEALFQKASVFHFDSLSTTDEPCRSALLKAVGLAKANRAVISFDVNYRPVLWKSDAAAAEAVFEFASMANIVKLNDTEVKLFTGCSDIMEGAEKILDLGPDLVLVTTGAEGACYLSKNGKCSGAVSACSAGPVIDTIGCGDTFIAGFLTKLTECGKKPVELCKEELNDFCLFGNAAAAVTATRKGCIPAMPARSEVEQILRIELPEHSGIKIGI